MVCGQHSFNIASKPQQLKSRLTLSGLIFHLIVKHTQASTVRAELARLNGVHEDFPLERAAVHRVLRGLVALINAGRFPAANGNSVA